MAKVEGNQEKWRCWVSDRRDSRAYSLWVLTMKWWSLTWRSSLHATLLQKTVRSLLFKKSLLRLSSLAKLTKAFHFHCIFCPLLSLYFSFFYIVIGFTSIKEFFLTACLFALFLNNFYRHFPSASHSKETMNSHKLKNIA